MSTTTVRLPTADGATAPVTIAAPARLDVATVPPKTRRAYAAAHVVADPRTARRGAATPIDWEATLQLRHGLWRLGLGVAESMDTAQRGMGLDAPAAMELARRTLAAAGPDDHVVVGIATDDLPEGRPATLAQIGDAYLSQLQQVEDAGGATVLMASRHLAQAATSPNDYVEVYDRVLSEARRPITLHWLGAAFDPQLRGYWGHDDIDAAADTVIDIISAHSDAIDGIKVSLLDAAAETALRRRLPAGVRCYTGDDFSYPELIAGDEYGHSDALLGAFGTIPRFASAAFAALDAGDVARFREILDPTVPLSRLVFEAPTQYYKVGVTWLAYLDGAQDHFRMLDGFETGRSLTHLGSLVDAAGRIGLFSDPELTVERATRYFANHGL